VVAHRILACGQLLADIQGVVGVAGETDAVAVRDRKRRSRRNALLRDVVREPVETERRYDDAAHVVFVVVEWQRKLKHVATGVSADRELSDREFSGPHGVREVGASRGGSQLMHDGRDLMLYE